MPPLADLLHILHRLVLIGFLGVTTLLLLVTLTNRLRVQQVMMTWQTGRLWGVTAWPTLFIGLMLSLGVTAYVLQKGPAGLFLGYFVGGLFWLAAAQINASVLVTAFGLVRNVNRLEDVVAWAHIVDYFDVPQGRQQRFVFFYVNASGTRERIELKVPEQHIPAFRQLVRKKLDTRFELAAQKGYGKQALEG